MKGDPSLRHPGPRCACADCVRLYGEEIIAKLYPADPIRALWQMWGYCDHPQLTRWFYEAQRRYIATRLLSMGEIP